METARKSGVYFETDYQHCMPVSASISVKVASLLFLQSCPAKIFWNQIYSYESPDCYGKSEIHLRTEPPKGRECPRATSSGEWCSGLARHADDDSREGSYMPPLPCVIGTLVNFDMDQLPRAQNVCVAIFAYGDESSFPWFSGRCSGSKDQ
jgi:hypothetical protein